MDGAFESITCRRGFSFSTKATKYRSYACQKTNSTSQRTGEAKRTCRDCNKEFLVPTNITASRCYACQGFVSKSISGYEQPREDSGAKFSKHDQMGNANAGSSLSFSRRGNKRAVLCGVTYRKRKFKLNGTINDVNNMKDLLVKNFKFPTDCIRVLTEDQHDPNFIPTKRNILESLKWLVKDCQSGDSLVFYYSGHGLQQPEYYKEDEIDGLDETICPVDFMKEGMITDNEINSTIVWPLKNDVILHAILDACHSGTTLDLMHVYKQKNGIWNWEDNKPRSKEPIRKHTSGGVAICLSACEDSQMAADTTVFGRKEMNGVMTYLFTKTIREHHSTMTYGDLLEKIHCEIGKINQSKWYNNILKHIFHPKVEQDPLLSSSEIFDVYKTNFKL